MKAFDIKENDAGQRLDRFISKVCKNLPATLLQKFIRKGRTKVDGRKVKGDYRLREGERLELYLNDEFFETSATNHAVTLSVPGKLKVVYEDRNIIIADKPSGQLVHSDDSEGINTLISHICAYLWKKGEYNPNIENFFTPALCHRLDRNTSGLVIAAKNAEALRNMNDIIKHRKIRKIYHCVVLGTPTVREATIHAHLERDKNLKRVFVTDGPKKYSQEIITKYRVMRSMGELCALEVELMTGRTHQIRAHLAHIGYPVLGDEKYGDNGANKRYGLRKQLLLAYKLEFLGGQPEFFKYLEKKSFLSNLKLELSGNILGGKPS